MPLRAALRTARNSQTGSVAIMLALLISVLIGFAALGTETGYAMFKQRQMLAAASAAALSAANAMMTGHPASPATEAKAVAAAAGFVHGTGGVTVTVNTPPLSGPYTGAATAIEVIVGQPQTLPMSSLFSTEPWTVSARAVAATLSSGGGCVLATATGNNVAITVNNGANVTLNGCGVASNATSSASLTVTGGAHLTTKAVSLAGNYSLSGGGTLTSTNTIQVNQPALTDPYAAVAVPYGSGCKYTNKTLAWAATTQTLNPDGVYCGGITMGNGAIVNMNPGVYIFSGGSFNIGGGTTLTGTGVTIVLTGTGTNYTTVSLGGGASVTLSAPTTGTTAGMLFFQDPKAPTTGSNNFAGGATETLTGALYFPSQTLVYSNGTTSTATCTQLVALKVQFTGGAMVNSNCTGTGTKPIGPMTRQLVE